MIRASCDTVSLAATSPIGTIDGTANTKSPVQALIQTSGPWDSTVLGRPAFALRIHQRLRVLLPCRVQTEQPSRSRPINFEQVAFFHQPLQSLFRGEDVAMNGFFEKSPVCNAFQGIGSGGISQKIRHDLFHDLRRSARVIHVQCPCWNSGMIRASGLPLEFPCYATVYEDMLRLFIPLWVKRDPLEDHRQSARRRWIERLRGMVGGGREWVNSDPAIVSGAQHCISSPVGQRSAVPDRLPSRPT